MTSIDGPSIGRRVAAYRKLNGWTMDQLASRTENTIGKGVIANIETGRKNELTVPQLVALAEALAVPPLALLVDMDELTASSGVELVGDEGDLRRLTNIGFIRWFAGTIPVEYDGDEDELPPAAVHARKRLNAIHDLVNREEAYAASLASYAVQQEHAGKAQLQLLVERVRAAEDARDAARRRLNELGVALQKEGGGANGQAANPAE